MSAKRDARSRKKASAATSQETVMQLEASSEEASAAYEDGVVGGDAVSKTKRQRSVGESQEPVNEEYRSVMVVDREPAESAGEKLSLRRPGQFFSREQWLSWAPYVGVILLGALLRFWNVGDKPLHHDESLHAYFALQLMHNNLENWSACATGKISCYHYDPLLHGPFQFHLIAIVYQICQWLHVPDFGVNTTTVRLGAATLGSVIVALPYFLRSYLGRLGAWLACFLLAISPSLVYFSRFAREDIYMACFTMLLVVAAGNYVRTRRGLWLLLAAIGFILSYATKEATYLSIAIFGSFLAMVLVWEIGLRWSVRKHVNTESTLGRYAPVTAAPLALAAFLIVLGLIAKWFFGWMKDLSTFVNDPKNADTATKFVQNLKSNTIALSPWLGILLGAYVLSILIREMLNKLPMGRERWLAKRVDPKRQPLLDTIVTMPWTHWFFALMSIIVIFLVLYTALFTYMPAGIGDGVWQGLYYWLQQQNIARGGQPWYYYVMLIPLYEQIGVVFGIVGIVRCLRHPSYFRLFLVYWFAGNFFIYSWAGEKMPWLMIHITMPLMLLAAIGLEPLVVKISDWLAEEQNKQNDLVSTKATVKRKLPVAPARPVWVRINGVATALSGVLAIFLLVLTIHNMFQVTYVHAADGPHEMMIYVQTTRDVNTVMDKIDTLDQTKFGGQHKIAIGVMADAEWPFYWYLRDYTNVCYNYPNGCGTMNPAVILTGGDNLTTSQAQYSTVVNGKAPDYLFHQYHLRSWWDEGYKPLPCVVTATEKCIGQPAWGGVGALTWLSYGDTPPSTGAVDLGKAMNHIWQWWWYRTPIGGAGGSTDMGLFIRKDLGLKP
ncbi:flippase activity-associated protein Agl23 [Tengunoibacter tsumagoiensis]|uniref:Glycosyltransferase RgtA/B/C/D-like domain-containing protein n=1 Tax=Tengunoibacter tsumagoiensis TaxID=2014871 RepID=A0A401ZXW9_9CHLR|nr:flippase activity-associated protein Agl23 [Tengunoibacter tsumagoiensis]GCE11687.1 hypothetical protein KTT_15460 [Tengunoibacter tsumagoiensis]